MEFSAVSSGEGREKLVFELADADFQQLAGPSEDWEDAFMVFRPAGEWFILRKMT